MNRQQINDAMQSSKLHVFQPTCMHVHVCSYGGMVYLTNCEGMVYPKECIATVTIPSPCLQARDKNVFEQSYAIS